MKLPRLNPSLLPLLATLGVFAAMIAIGAIAFRGENFFTVRTGANLFHQSAIIAVAAIGGTLVILSGGIDLSVGAVVAFTTVLIAVMIESGYHPLVAWAAAMACGTGLGLFMGWLIHSFALPAFMVTLAGMFFARAMAFWVAPQNLAIKSDLYTSIQYPAFRIDNAPVTWLALTAIACYVVAIIIAHLTNYGRYVYAIGGDEESARLMGVPVGRTRIATYTIAGFCSSLAGVMATLLSSNGDPAKYVGMELDVIAAVVIGGTLITGGVGFILGTLCGTLIQTLIGVMIDWKGDISSWWTKIVVGLLVLAFIVAQRVLLALGARRAAKSDAGVLDDKSDASAARAGKAETIM